MSQRFCRVLASASLSKQARYHKGSRQAVVAAQFETSSMWAVEGVPTRFQTGLNKVLSRLFRWLQGSSFNRFKRATATVSDIESTGPAGLLEDSSVA